MASKSISLRIFLKTMNEDDIKLEVEKLTINLEKEVARKSALERDVLPKSK